MKFGIEGLCVSSSSSCEFR